MTTVASLTNATNTSLFCYTSNDKKNMSIHQC